MAGQSNIFCLFNDGSATIYAIIRRQSDAFVWNGSGFEVWNDANYLTYVISISYQGGFLFSAPIPALPADIYTVIFYQQGGANPAVGDEILDTYTFTWNGVVIAPTGGSVILDPYALATLEDTLAELVTILPQDNSQNDLIKDLINDESYHFEAMTDRKIVNRYYKEFVNGRYSVHHPRQVPVTNIVKLSGESNVAFWLDCSQSSTLIRITYYQDTNDIVHIDTWDTTGTKISYTFDTATYKTSATLFAAIMAANINGLTGQLQNLKPVPSDFLFRTAPQPILTELASSNMAVCYSCDDVYDMRIINNGYGIGFTGRNFDIFLLEYWAGFVTVPFDVRAAVIDAVKSRWTLLMQQLPFDSQSIGKYSYKMRSSDYSELWNQTIKRYRRPGVVGR